MDPQMTKGTPKSRERRAARKPAPAPAPAPSPVSSPSPTPSPVSDRHAPSPVSAPAPAPPLTAAHHSLRRKVLRVRVEEWNASHPDLAMKMVPFTRNVFESGRFKFKVSYISGLVLDKNGDILKPYFEGTDNDVIFIMHYGFITTCKLEDVLRAFDRRRVVHEAILSNEIVLGKKGMELACEQLPYPKFGSEPRNPETLGAQTRGYVLDEETIACKDTKVAVLRFYVKDIFSEPEFVVMRGVYRTITIVPALDRTIFATAFLDGCCICGEESLSMKCPYECAKHSLCADCYNKLPKRTGVCPLCRSPRMDSHSSKPLDV